MPRRGGCLKSCPSKGFADLSLGRREAPTPFGIHSCEPSVAVKHLSCFLKERWWWAPNSQQNGWVVGEEKDSLTKFCPEVRALTWAVEHLGSIPPLPHEEKGFETSQAVSPNYRAMGYSEVSFSQTCLLSLNCSAVNKSNMHCARETEWGRHTALAVCVEQGVLREGLVVWGPQGRLVLVWEALWRLGVREASRHLTEALSTCPVAET